MKFDHSTVTRWKQLVEQWFCDVNDPGTPNDVFLGAEAWVIAHRVGITAEAYKDRTVTDAHIVTSLKQIFPNATFKDNYRY